MSETKKETSRPLKGTGDSPSGSNLWGSYMDSQVLWASLETRPIRVLPLNLGLGRPQKALSSLWRNKRKASDEVEEQPGSEAECGIWREWTLLPASAVPPEKRGEDACPRG